MPRSATWMLMAAVPMWLATATLRQWLRVRRVFVRADGRDVASNVRHLPIRTAARVLIVGDSTGAGVGAEGERQTLHGMLREEFPFVGVWNRCANGARMADVVEQARRVKADARRFDVALIVAGGNDVLHATDAATLSAQVGELLDLVASIARKTVWLGCADVGHAPILVPPFSWWFSWRTHLVARVIAAAARGREADVVDFSSGIHRRHIDEHRRLFFASDGMHPTGSAYRYCYGVLRELPAIRSLMGSRETEAHRGVAASHRAEALQDAPDGPTPRAGRRIAPRG